MTKKSKTLESAAEPQHGTACGGESISPTSLPEEIQPEGHEPKPQAAPGPGIPMSIEEYQLLKKSAETSSTAHGDIAQEDRPRKQK